jgi:hypothetical protein
VEYPEPGLDLRPCDRNWPFPPRAGVMSVPEHPLRCGPETSVTSPLRWGWFELRGAKRQIHMSRSLGMWESRRDFQRSVGRVGSRLHGFPYSAIPWPAFARQMLDKPMCRHQMQCAAFATRCSSVLVIECIGDLAPIHRGSFLKRLYQEVTCWCYLVPCQ